MVMLTSFLVTLLLQVWLHNADIISAMFFDDSNTRYYDTVMLRDVTPTSSRTRRSADDMPDHLHFDFNTGSHEVSLRLRRSEHIQMGKLPVFTIGDNQELIKADLPEKTDTAVYRDIHHGAAVVAKRHHGVGKEFQLSGTLHVDNKMFTITPHTELTSPDNESDAMQHVLRVIQNDDTYGLDYVEPENEVSPAPPPLALHSLFNLRRRVKRQLKPVSSDSKKSTNPESGRYNIKINIVCDFACYKSEFYDRHGNNEKLALEEARMYFSYLAQSLDVRFRTISTLKPGLLLTVTPTSIVSATSPKGSSFSEAQRVNGTTRGINGNKLLPAFRTWVSKSKLPKAATTLLQTGYNMMTNGLPAKAGQLGIGYRGGACGSSGVVVVEEKFHGITGMIAAHEVGHNLNSKHDGSYAQEDTTCTGDGSRNVMSTYIGVPHGSSKPWTFSECSADRIVQFVTSGRPACFPDDYEQMVPDDAGQVYDADDQCSTTFGKGSYFCRGRQAETAGFDGMCTKMYCSTTPAQPDTCTSVIPLEYTSCGNKKWCIRGQCVYDVRAPSKIQDTCAQGDDPTYGCDAASCRTSLGRNVFCCQSCLAPIVRPRPTTVPRTSPVLPTVRQTSSPTRLTPPSGTSRQRPQPTTSEQRQQPTRIQTLPPTTRLQPPTPPPTTQPRQQPSTARLTQRPPETKAPETASPPPPPPPSPRPTTTTTTTTTQPPSPSPSTENVPTTQIALPAVCRYSRMLCLVCLRSQFTFYFCRF